MPELIPRLPPWEMPPELVEMLRPRVERLGYLGEFFQCAAQQPRALMSFMRRTRACTTMTGTTMAIEPLRLGIEESF